MQLVLLPEGGAHNDVLSRMACLDPSRASFSIPPKDLALPVVEELLLRIRESSMTLV